MPDEDDPASIPQIELADLLRKFLTNDQDFVLVFGPRSGGPRRILSNVEDTQALARILGRAALVFSQNAQELLLRETDIPDA